MTIPASFKPFATTLRSNGRASSIVFAFTGYDEIFVRAVKDMGARFQETAQGKGWYVFADSQHVESFRAACKAARSRVAEKAAAQASAEPRGLRLTGNIDYDMYNPNGALYG